jgi:hypothetical protein
MHSIGYRRLTGPGEQCEAFIEHRSETRKSRIDKLKNCDIVKRGAFFIGSQGIS